MDLKEELKFSRAAFAAGQWTAGELTCRRILAYHPKHVPALEFLGRVAAHAGASEQAEMFFEQARANLPPLQKLFLAGKAISQKRLLARTAARRGVDTLPGDRYLVIKSWGYGFWSDVSQVLGGLLLTEVTRRTPVIFWGKNSLFGDGSARDAFQNYFEPVSAPSVAELANIEGATFFPPKWHSANLAEENVAKWHGAGARLGAVEFLNRPETVAVMDFYSGVPYVAPWLPKDHVMHDQPAQSIFGYLIRKYLHPQAVVRSRCNSFHDIHLAGAPFVAVHMRGSDKVVEEKGLEATNRQILSALDSIPHDHRIFLLTDDERILSLVKGKYGGRVIATSCQRTNGTKGTHYLPTTDRVEAGLEVMVDTYLALRADKFIGNGLSNVSAMIAQLRDWSPQDCMLLGRSVLLTRQLFHYRNV